MKKKNVEKLAQTRQARIEALESMMGARREEIMRLKGEIQGLKELNGILESIIYQITDEKKCVEVSRSKLREGINTSFSISATEDKFILRADS